MTQCKNIESENLKKYKRMYEDKLDTMEFEEIQQNQTIPKSKQNFQLSMQDFTELWAV